MGLRCSSPVSLDEYRAAFLDALLARDSARARQAVDDALSDGVPVPDIYLERARPGAARDRAPLGDGRAQRRRGALRDRGRAVDPRRPRPPAARGAPKDGRLAVVSGTPEELHALGTRVVADFLEADGWEVLLLGPGAPARDLAALVESEQPDLVALSTATAGVLDGVVEVLGALARARHRGRASSPAASSGPPRRARARSSSAPTSSLQDPRELVATLHERIPPPGSTEQLGVAASRDLSRLGRLARMPAAALSAARSSSAAVAWPSTARRDPRFRPG